MKIVFSPRPLLLSSVTLCILLIAACAGNPALRSAHDFAESQDWLNAVLSYRQALEADPLDEKIIASLKAAEETLANVTFNQASTSLEAGEFEQAWSTLNVVSHILYPHEALETLHDTVEQSWAKELEEKAIGFESEGLVGNALTRWAMINLVTKSEASQEKMTTLSDEIIRDIQFSFDYLLTGQLQGEVLLSWSDTAVTSLNSDAQRVFSASLGESNFSEYESRQTRYHRYISGTEWVRNWEYVRAVRALTDARQSVLDWEYHVGSREIDENNARELANQHQQAEDYNSYYNQWTWATRQLQDARNSLYQARQYEIDREAYLHSTPQTVEQNVWDRYPYTVTTHTRSATAVYRFEHSMLSNVIFSYSETLSESTRDESYPGNNSVGLNEDQFGFPRSRGGLNLRLVNQAMAMLRESVRQAFHNYRSGFSDAARASGEPEQAVENWVRHSLLDVDEMSSQARSALHEFGDLIEHTPLIP